MRKARVLDIAMVIAILAVPAATAQSRADVTAFAGHWQVSRLTTRVCKPLATMIRV
ncbi:MULTISPECIES: hypothetical protein [unclassified Sphingomonas]|jgi:hypothetical protein|uniref:hypothetical protein n=1 Tax=unclassified Sphingomonas TaxID=196159 RepID=UPI0010E8B312|nr:MULTISPECIES: hypothetical protein [unclassified Sphingomonas]TCM05550.1 hypothetical protein C8J41_10736 [Sphingomonas sp. PP-CC-3G-468]